MGWLMLLGVVVLLIGPLRPWVGRHWAFLVSAVLGGGLGFLAGAWVLGTCGTSVPFLPLLWAAVGAIALGRAGPAWLRRISNDGRN